MAAEVTGVGLSLNLAVAKAIIQSTLAHAGATTVPPLTVVVLDSAGHLVAAQRQDGASMFRFEVAMGKAWGAVAMGCSSRALADRASLNPNFFGALAVTGRGRFLPQPGAVVVWGHDGTVLGAVGASGGTGDEDESCCIAGVSAAGFSLDKDVEGPHG